MDLRSVIELSEARGSGSFDYRYWFWAKKGSSYGIAYARQPIELDIQRTNREAEEALQNIKNVMDALEKRGEKEGKEKELEIIEKKIKPKIARLKGIIDLPGSPIVVHWLSSISTENSPEEEIKKPVGERPIVVTVPLSRKGDVVDANNNAVNVVRLFRDPDTTKLIKNVNWTRIKINDSEGDTQNTIVAKFVKSIFAKTTDEKKQRAFARGPVLESIMKNLKFKDEKTNIEIVPFKPNDYKLFPANVVGSKDAVLNLKELMKNKFSVVLKRARSAF